MVFKIHISDEHHRVHEAETGEHVLATRCMSAVTCRNMPLARFASVNLQVLWSTFSSLPTQLPGILAVLCGLLFIALMRAGRLPDKARASWQLLSGWTATLLFMLMPVAQLKVRHAS